MNWNSLLPLLVVATSLIPGIAIFLLREEQRTARTAMNMAGAISKLVLVAAMLWGVTHGQAYELSFVLTGDLVFALHVSPLSLLFLSLSSVLWLFTTVYAIGYLEDSPNRRRFFGFFSLCVSATTGIAVAANLFTLVIFYEILTLTTYPLVVHEGTPKAMRGGRIYLTYTIGGGALLMFAVISLQSIAGAVPFVERGVLSEVDPSLHPALRW